MKKEFVTAVSVLSLISLFGSTAFAGEIPQMSGNVESNAHVITLSETGSASIDGTEIEVFDYTWHVDPTTSHDEVKDCPAQYFTGDEPDTQAAAYIAHDIYYYPLLDENDFELVNYDGEMEYVYRYQDGEHDEYIFSTLPQLKEFSSQMMHSEEEAYSNPVLHIQEAGTYILEGSWQGQINIDLGDKDDVFANPDKKVTIILNGVDVECTVAPAIIFKSVYECDNAWEDAEEHTGHVDTSDAGAKVIIADDTVNNVTGSNVFRLLKAKYKNEDSEEEVKVQKKAIKTDGAFYSYMSMNIEGDEYGTGILNITSTTFEGLDSELHLTINGGNINIYTQDDGINVNEDHVSVFTMNNGSLHIYAGLGAEGDGIDSNGFITVNGGTLVTVANPISDNGMDSEDGSEINGGTAVILGSSMFTNSWAVYVDGEAQYGSSLGESNGGPGRFDSEMPEPPEGGSPGDSNGGPQGDSQGDSAGGPNGPQEVPENETPVETEAAN